MRLPAVRLPRPSPALLFALACGGVFGLGLARGLYEADPLRLALLDGWPTALLLALAGALAAGAFRARFPGPALAPAALLLPLLHLASPETDPLRALALLLGGLGMGALLWRGEGLDQPGAVPWLDLTLGGLLLIAYLRTLAPTVGEADTFEFQVGIARLGIAHGSGYPLLMLVGRLFSLLPLGGTLAWRANLTSACFGALAGWGVARLARRLGARPRAAFLAGLTFGLSPSLWSRAVEVEAYTLNAALVAFLLELGLRQLPNPKFQIPTLQPPASCLLPLTCLLLGLSLTNHLTTLLLVPALAFALAWAWIADPSARPSARTLGLALLCLLLGLMVYLYVPLRWPAVNHGEWLTWPQFLNLLSGGEAKGAFDPGLPLRDGGRYLIVGRKILEEYGWPGVALGLLGLASLLWARTPRRVRDAGADGMGGAGGSQPAQSVRSVAGLVVLALAYLGYVYFGLAFNVPDPDFSSFFIPLHLILAALLGAGLHGLLAALARLRLAALAPLILLAFSLLPISALWQTLPRVDRSQAWSAYRQGQFMLSQPLSGGAAILADSKRIAPLYYLQVAEGVRPDLEMIVLPDEASYRAALDERVAAGQTVYLARYLPGLGSGYSLRSVGPLAQVSAAPYLSPLAPEVPLSLTLASGIQLTGYQAEALRLAPSGPLRLTLAWRAPDQVDDNYLVHLRLRAADGRVAWQSAGRVPVADMYPTNAWRPGEQLSDFHSLDLPEALAPGDYQLEVGLFRPFRVEESGWQPLAPVQLIAPEVPPAIARPLRAHFGPATLLGYAAPDSAAPGARLKLTLYWQRSPGVEHVTAFGQSADLSAWPVGAVVPVVYDLAAPPGAGRFVPVIETGAPARCGWLAPASAGCRLKPIHLSGSPLPEGALNFDNQLALVRVAIETPRAAPGGKADVTLTWQGLQSMAADYTVFVHLLGPDGQVHGQVDAWPVSGTLATSRWIPGQPVEDRYHIPIPVDAPSGPYQVEIGLYLLETLQRLPVLNAEGAPVDDKLLVPGLTLE